MAELLWRTPDGPPGAIGVVPLLLDEQPAVALPWAHAATARAAAVSDTVVLALSEPRLTGSAWEPMAFIGRPTLVEDDDGSLFSERLLDQELRKHPPSRALADSHMLRREHWWYLPRLVVLVDPVAVVPIGTRHGPADAVLGVDDGALQVATVAVADWSAAALDLRGGPDDVRGPAVLIGQEMSVPDLERWTVHTTTGDYADGRLTDVRPAENRSLEPVPGLLTRMRRQRTLERSCIAALRAGGHA